MQLIKNKISLNDLKNLVAKGFGDFIKAVVEPGSQPAKNDDKALYVEKNNIPHVANGGAIVEKEVWGTGSVDVDKGIMVIDAELHADEEAFLLENGSKQEYLWGINIYPALEKADRIEFDSMINLKPSQGNRSRSVENKNIQEKIIIIVKGLIDD